MADTEIKVSPPDVRIETDYVSSTKNDNGIVLIPQPSDDLEDPLNWTMHRKLLVFASICLAGFAAQMSPNSNQLTFIYQIPAYHSTQAALLNSVAAGLAGWVVGPFFFIPFVAVVGRSSVVLWSLAVIFVCQIWAAQMTGPDDYISFTISRLICGLFGGIPAILGSGYIMDMFFLHQRGKAFAIFEVLIIFAVVGGGTLGGFIAETKPWNYVFWWTLGPVGSAIMAVFLFVEDTTFPRRDSIPRPAPLPRSWFENRVATFLPGTKTQPSHKCKELVRRVIIPFQITFSPITLLTGTYIFIALGLPIMQASTLATYLEPPTEAGGYGFSSLQMAFFTMTAWVGIIGAQVYGFLFNDKIPLWLARRRGGTWHTEYRLANTALPSIILPIGLGIYGAGLEYHLHFMVLALGSFLIWFGALLALPVCYNYIIECFLHHPVEASVSLNAYRVSFGLMSVFIVTQWQGSVGVGWMWGMGAFFILFVDLIMLGIILKGHLVRKWMDSLSSNITATEDGAKISIIASQLNREGPYNDERRI